MWTRESAKYRPTFSRWLMRPQNGGIACIGAASFRIVWRLSTRVNCELLDAGHTHLMLSPFKVNGNQSNVIFPCAIAFPGPARQFGQQCADQE